VSGDPPSVRIDRNGNIKEIRARLVACADGRNEEYPIEHDRRYEKFRGVSSGGQN